MAIQLGELTLFTVEELAETLGIQERTIRDYLRDGKLKGRKMAGRWYIPESSLKEYFEGEAAALSAESDKEAGDELKPSG